MGKLRKSSKQSEPRSPVKRSAALQSQQRLEELYALGKSLRDKCPR